MGSGVITGILLSKHANDRKLSMQLFGATLGLCVGGFMTVLGSLMTAPCEDVPILR